MLAKRSLKIKRSLAKKISVYSLIQVGSVLLILIFAVIYFKTSFFTVHFIDCSKDGYLCNENDLSLLNDLLGKKIFRINKKDIINNALHKNITLEDLTISIKIPNKVFARLVSRTPVAVYSAKNGEFLVDDTGFIYNTAGNNLNLPLVIASNNQGAIIGTISEPKVIKAVDLAKTLNEFFIPFQKIEIDNGDLLVYSYDNIIFFAGNKDLVNQASSLQLILRSSKINQQEDLNFSGNKKITKIDLRFDKPVIIGN